MGIQNIIDKLGKPHSQGDAYKTDAQWAFKFEDGTVATLYNWKDGKNYCGADGLNLEDITSWNIGGFSPDAVYKIEEALK
jgi:hypothetical protein